MIWKFQGLGFYTMHNLSEDLILAGFSAPLNGDFLDGRNQFGRYALYVTHDDPEQAMLALLALDLQKVQITEVGI